jgi:hypothetical protein
MSLQQYQCKQDKIFILTHTEAPGEQQMFGLELEYIFAPDVSRMACIAFLINAEMITLHELRMQSLEALSNISFLLMEPLKVDGENDELVLFPMSRQAAYNLKPHLDVLFKSLKSHGYEPWGPLNEIGMHISVERKMITSTALERTLWWMYYNNDLFVYLSGRKNYSTIRADIHYLLGDKYKRWDPQIRKNRAEDLFSIFINAFNNKTFADIVGIRTYLDKPYIQFTQFGSTLSPDEFLTKIEFVDALLNWNDTKEDYDPQSFLKSIQKAKYPHLYSELQALKI